MTPVQVTHNCSQHRSKVIKHNILVCQFQEIQLNSSSSAVDQADLDKDKKFKLQTDSKTGHITSLTDCNCETEESSSSPTFVILHA